jgi:hypothetical protein
MDLEAVAEALKELGTSLRRMALALGLLTVRMSSSCSDRAVARVPRGLRRFKAETPTLN